MASQACLGQPNAPTRVICPNAENRTLTTSFVQHDICKERVLSDDAGFRNANILVGPVQEGVQEEPFEAKDFEVCPAESGGVGCRFLG